MTTPLARALAAQIAHAGPISVADYMAACLYDPAHGYYAARPGIGADFVTAPAVSQMFGELIGAWCAHEWRELGAPDPFALIELGPGDGALLSDLLRAARAAPRFAAAARVTLVEVSAPLRAAQAERLRPHPIEWRERLDDVAPGPALILGNEFLDCLPIRQFVRTPQGWRERLVGLGDDGALAFGLSAPLPPALAPAAPGAFHEFAPALPALVATIAARLATDPGRALFIDYGDAAPEGADTLQALRAHAKQHPLAAPGEADLTAHVDFAALARCARAAGLDVAGPLPQRAFLAALGLGPRADALARAHPDRAPRIAREVERLTDPAQMGALFKVLCLSSPGLPAPAGL